MGGGAGVGVGGGDGGGGVCDCGEGEFYVCDFGGRAEPRAITEGAGRCGRLRIAPDGTGVAYLATHGSGTCLGLWWVPWEGGVPPQPLTPPHAPILHFGWAPSEEVDEPADKKPKEPRTREDEESGSESEASLEPLSGLRLWVSTQRGLQVQTSLTDLIGTALAFLDMPVCGPAVAWMDDGRRVQVTETLHHYPSLWDGGALVPLPVAAGLTQVLVRV